MPPPHRPGSAALRAAHVEPEEVSRLLDEFADLQTVQDEVSDAFAATANSDMEELEKLLSSVEAKLDAIASQSKSA